MASSPIPSKAPEPTSAQIEEASEDLDFFEAWCGKTDTAPSALGRHVLEDQALIFRWKAKGIGGASEEKRRRLAHYCLTHPDGIPGYKRGKTGRRRPTSHRFNGPGSGTSAFSTVKTGEEGKPTSTIPSPSPSLLGQSDFEYAKAKAFNTGQPIATILADFAALGIRCEREAEYEENCQPQPKESDNE